MRNSVISGPIWTNKVLACSGSHADHGKNAARSAQFFFLLDFYAIAIPTPVIARRVNYIGFEMRRLRAYLQHNPQQHPTHIRYTLPCYLSSSLDDAS